MTLLDRMRALFKPQPVAQAMPLYRQVAVNRVFEWLGGVPDPDEVLRRTGRSRADLRELLRDAEVSQAIDTRREAVLATPWHLEPGTSEAEKFVFGELSTHLHALVAAAWQAALYGYSVCEVVYTKRAGRVGIAGVHEPPFEWFRPLPDGSLRFFPQTGEGGTQGIECDPRKFILSARNASYRNPYGEALLSVLYWPVSWRLQGWQLWLNFLDTFGAPIVIGRTGNYDQFVAAMQAQGVTRTVGWQATTPDDAISTINASTPGEFERLENALDRMIQRVVLGQTLTSDVGKTGSYAAAKVHNEVREDKRRADIRMVTRTVQSVIDALWQINAFPSAPAQFCMQDDVGLERERADRDAVLAEKLGVRFTPEYLSDHYDLELEDFTLTEPTPAASADAPPANNSPVKPKLDAIFTRPIDDLALSARLENILKANNIYCIGELASSTEKDLRKIANIGRNSITEIKEVLACRGMSLGMNLENWRGASRTQPTTFTPQQQAIEGEIARLAPDLGLPLSPDELRSAIRASADVDELEARLAVLLDRQDPAFADALARATFAGNVLGYLHAAE